MKVGILGGTFDPVHNGHLAIATAARDQLGLNLVLFIPAGEPWRKAHRMITAAEHRLAMLKLAVAADHAFGISDIELRRAGPTYTADTLEALAAERLDDEFCFIVGADALADLPNWRQPERIVQHAMLAVAPRGGQALADTIAALPGIEARIERFDMPPTPVSSSDIRARVTAGQPITGMLPRTVERYIADHNLYAP